MSTDAQYVARWSRVYPGYCLLFDTTKSCWDDASLLDGDALVSVLNDRVWWRARNAGISLEQVRVLECPRVNDAPAAVIECQICRRMGIIPYVSEWSGAVCGIWGKRHVCFECPKLLHGWIGTECPTMCGKEHAVVDEAYIVDVMPDEAAMRNAFHLVNHLRRRFNARRRASQRRGDERKGRFGSRSCARNLLPLLRASVMHEMGVQIYS